MISDANKTLLFTTIFLVFVLHFDYVRTEEHFKEVDVSVVKDIVPETLAIEVQGHENTSERKVRQFGYPLLPPSPFGLGFGYRPFPPRPGFYGPIGGGGGGGFAGGGFQRTRVVTRTQTRVVDRYRGGGFRGGFYG